MSTTSTTTEPPVASAEDHYRRALGLAPANAGIISRLGGLLEGSDRYVEALSLYLEFANRWNRVFHIRYRIAADLGMSDQWLWSIAMASESERLRAAGLLGARAVELSDDAGPALAAGYARAAGQVQSPTVRGLHAALLEAADAEWESLGRFLALGPSTRRVLGAVVSRRRDRRDAAYQLAFVRSRRQRRARLQTVRAAHLVTRTRRVAPWPLRLSSTPGSEVAEELRRSASDLAADRGLSPDGRYAVACAYARLWEVFGDAGDAASAVDQLKQVVLESSSSRWVSTISSDPDLLALRRTELFVRWWGQLVPSSPPWDLAAWTWSLLEALVSRWRTEALLGPGDGDGPAEPGPGRAEDVDEEVLALLLRVLAGDSPTAALELVEAAAALGIRVELPPETGGDHLPSLSEQQVFDNERLPMIRHLQRAREYPRSSAGLRVTRWERVAALVVHVTWPTRPGGPPPPADAR